MGDLECQEGIPGQDQDFSTLHQCEWQEANLGIGWLAALQLSIFLVLHSEDDMTENQFFPHLPGEGC